MANTAEDCNCSSQYVRLLKDYWKLSCPAHMRCSDAKAAMGELGFKFPASAEKGRLIYLLHRAERGLISYDSCSVSELGKFVENRGLSGKVDKSSSKPDLIQHLELADEERIFERLAELPAELRCKIYDFHINSFETVGVQPLPITQASRLVRQEAQPLFYENSRLMVHITCHDHTADCRTVREYREHSGGPSLFERAEIGNISRIRSLRIMLDYRFSFDMRPHRKEAWDLNFLEDPDHMVVKLHAANSFNSFGDVRREVELQKVVSDLGSDPAARRVQRGTLRAICLACDVEPYYRHNFSRRKPWKDDYH